MTEGQYRSLCDACDLILLDPSSTPETVAIPWLHIIREHPVFLRNYENLLKHSDLGTTIRHRSKLVLRSVASWLHQMFRAIRASGACWFEAEELPKQADIIFISHLLTEAHVGEPDDFYFSDLPRKLIGEGYSVVVALINHTGCDGGVLARKLDTSVVPKVVLSESLLICDEMQFHRKLKAESRRLNRLAVAESPSLRKMVLEQASGEVLGSGARRNLRLSKQVGTLVAKLKPESIVVTYEGHAWERLAFSAAHGVSNTVKCIGYQHATLFKLQHAIRRNLVSRYNPDEILTAGFIACAQLSLSSGLSGIPISVLGSSRFHRQIDLNSDLKAGKNNRLKEGEVMCLVIPEGIESECRILFDFSLKCARASPHVTFIWRLHPILTFQHLISSNSKLRKLPSNIQLSNKSLEEDIGRCQFALYRGSTAIVQAVSGGLRPIYYSIPCEISIDPLYEVGDYRAMVQTVSDFSEIVKKYDQLQLTYSMESKVSARQYCSRLYSQLDLDALLCAHHRRIVSS